MAPRTISAGLIFAAALASGAVMAQQPAGSTAVARLTGVQGNVLVSQADSMAAAGNDQPLAAGVRVITTAGGRATVAYSNGCSRTLGENRRYTVRQQDACPSAVAPPLGKASAFAVLAGTNVGNVGETVITGDLGVSPGKTVSGFPPGRVSVGAIHAADDQASEAQKDAVKAYENIVGQRCDTKLTGQDLGGLTLTPGVYCFSAAKLTGELILDAEGELDAVWVFQVGSSLTTADKSMVKVINGGGRCNIYWQVATTASLGKESEFSGNIIAVGGVDAGEKAQGVGRVLSRNGAVVLNNGAIDRVACLVPLGFWTPATTALAVGGAVAIGAGIVEITKNPKSPN